MSVELVNYVTALICAFAGGVSFAREDWLWGLVLTAFMVVNAVYAVQ